MKKLLTFALFLGLSSSLFALSNKDLARKAAEVQQKFKLTDWKITIRFVTFEEMLGQNKCKCFGESLVFWKTKTAAIIILDDEGYRTLGWTGSLEKVHENELFATAHEVLHLFVETEHPEFQDSTDDDLTAKEEAIVQRLARVVYHQPELK